MKKLPVKLFFKGCSSRATTENPAGGPLPPGSASPPEASAGPEPLAAVARCRAPQRLHWARGKPARDRRCRASPGAAPLPPDARPEPPAAPPRPPALTRRTQRPPPGLGRRRRRTPTGVGSRAHAPLRLRAPSSAHARSAATGWWAGGGQWRPEGRGEGRGGGGAGAALWYWRNTQICETLISC